MLGTVGRECGQVQIRTGREFSSNQSLTKIAQPFDRGCRLLQAAEGEIQLMTIGNRGQQIANRRRLMSLQHQIAQGEKITQALGHLLAFNQ